MKIKRLVLCIVITMVFSFGLGTISVLADETQMNKELSTSELGNNSGVDTIESNKINTEESDDVATEEVILDTAKTSDAQEVSKQAVLGAYKEFKKETKKDSTSKEITSNKATATAKKAENTTKTTVKKVKSVAKEEAKYTKSELRLLAALVYSEAGNQSYKGKLAVANVVLNREKSSAYSHANTIKEVIYDSKWGVQFSVIKKNKSGSSPLTRALSLYDNIDSKKGGEADNMKESIKAAKAALNGNNNIGSYLYFSRTSSYLKSRYKNHVIIGDHIFYNTK